MRQFLLLVALVLVSVACSNTAGTGPMVTIDSATATGTVAELVFTVGGDGGPATFEVEWGDDTAEAPTSGQGQFRVTHEYAPDVESVVIAVEVTDDDGTVASDTARVELEPSASAPGDTTTTTAAEATTTAPSETTTPPIPDTTTTVPPTTTTSTSTTVPPTTTTSTTSTTTTTLPPEPVEVSFTLDLSTGWVVERWGGGALQSDWKNENASTQVDRHDDSWEEDGIRIRFPVPKSDYLDLAEDAVVMGFEFLGTTQAQYEIDTDKSDGNAARIGYGMHRYGDASIGTSHGHSINEDDNVTRVNHRTSSVGVWTLSSGEFNEPQYIDLWLECAARGPGGLGFSESECDADILLERLQVIVTGYPQGATVP